MKRWRLLCFVLSLLLLASGIAIYFLFRKNAGILLFDWFPVLRPLEGLAIPVQADGNILLILAVYSVPGGLWLLSGLLLIRALWRADPKTGNVYARIFCALAFGSELSQMIGRMPGTFDPLDLRYWF